MNKKTQGFNLPHNFEDDSLLDKNVSTKSMSRHRQIEQLMKDFSVKNQDELKNKCKNKSGEALVYSANLLKKSANKFVNASHSHIANHL